MIYTGFLLLLLLLLLLFFYIHTAAKPERPTEIVIFIRPNLLKVDDAVITPSTYKQ
jgi:hypothetical protein